MGGRKKASPESQLPLIFYSPRPRPDIENGFTGLDSRIARHLSKIIAEEKTDRWELAAKVSRVLDREISKNMIDAYSAESREEHRLPFSVAVAIDLVLGKPAYLDLFASLTGATALVGDDALLAELGRLEDEERKLKELKAGVKELLKRRG